MLPRSAVWRRGLPVLAVAVAAVDVCWSQEVIYVRPPAMVDGENVADGQKVDEGARLTTGRGGAVVVELRGWLATEDGPCTLFVVASGGRSVRVPSRESAQPRECRDTLSAVDRALQGTAVATSVLLFAAGPADRPRGELSEQDLYDRLPRGRRIDPPPARDPGRSRSAIATEIPVGLRIESATYGANCGAPAGNATSQLAAACNGLTRCDYVVDYLVIGDPVPGCAKDYRVTYTCTAGGLSQMVSIDPEAGFKKVLRLGCQ